MEVWLSDGHSLFCKANYRKYEYNPLEVRFDLKAERWPSLRVNSWRIGCYLYLVLFVVLLLFLTSPNTDAINDLGEV